MIVAVFTFNRRRDINGGGDMPPYEESEDRRNWLTSVGRIFCNSFHSAPSISSTSSDSRDTPKMEQPVEEIPNSPSTVVTIGSSIPSGSDLFERDSDIEYLYPDPVFTLDEPTSESEVDLVHKSISENLK